MTVLQDICDYVERETDIVLIPMTTWPRKPNTIHEMDHLEFQTGSTDVSLQRRSYNVLYHGDEKDALMTALKSVRTRPTPPFENAARIRDDEGWNAWVVRAGHDFVMEYSGNAGALLGGRLTSTTGPGVDGNYIDPLYTFTAHAMTAGDVITLTARVEVTSGEGPVLELNNDDDEYPVLVNLEGDSITGYNNTTPVTIASGLTPGVQCIITITYLTDTTYNVAVHEGGILKGSETLTTYNSYSWGNITSVRFYSAGGGGGNTSSLIEDFTLSWQSFTFLVPAPTGGVPYFSAQSNPHATHLGIWNNRDAYSIDFDVYY